MKRLTSIVALAATTVLPVVGRAQCPDGSPPPCGSARPPVAIDTQAVLVLPFAVRGPQDAEWLGGGMVDLFQMALDGLGGYRVFHPSTALRRLRGLKDPSNVVDAAPVARALGARYELGGSVVVLGQSVRLNCELYDAVRRRRVFPIVTQGDIARIGTLVDSLASVIVALGPLRNQSAAARTGEVITRYPGALRAYLAGEALARSGAHQMAADSLQHAILQDSTFGWAYYSLRKIMANYPQTRIAGGQDTLTLRIRQRLKLFPERLQIVFSTAPGSGGSRARRSLLDYDDQLAAQYPYDPEIAFRRADDHYHYGLNLGTPLRHVRQLFERSLDLDGDRPEILSHYVTILAHLGDTTALFRAYERGRVASPNDVSHKLTDAALRAVFRHEDPIVLMRSLPADATVDYSLPMLLPDDPARGLAIADSFATIRSQPEAPGAVRINSLHRGSMYALGTGRYDLARSRLNQAEALYSGSGLIAPRRLFFSLVTGTHRDEAAAIAKLLAPKRATLGLEGLSVLAWHEIAVGRPDSAESFISTLDAYARPDSGYAPSIAAGLRGLLALRLGDTTRARALLEKSYEGETRPLGTPAAAYFPSVMFALTLSRLALAAGDARLAQQYLFDAAPTHIAAPFLPQVEEQRGRVSEALADFPKARQAYRNVVKLLVNADAEAEATRTAAQDALGRLSDRP